MNFEGPLSDEALPVGEEVLSLEELSRVMDTVFEIIESVQERVGEGLTEVDVSPEDWELVQGIRTRMRTNLFDCIKRDFIDHRDD